jgi:hypothetical protein
MYNLNNHYDNIWHLALQRFSNPRIGYFMPFGSTRLEDIENRFVKLGDVDCTIFCYDQEPLIKFFNTKVFVENQDWSHADGFRYTILLNTELDSDPKNDFLTRFRFLDCYYFHHGLAASDWFRGAQFWPQFVPLEKRKLKHKFISFNRLTSADRVYRSLLINEFVKHDVLGQGLVSYSKQCPMGGDYNQELSKHKLVPDYVKLEAISNISQIKGELRIDYKEEELIPNQSYSISCIPECMETFLYIVSETCYWGRKKHLTEKIFKPVVCRMPFVLVGPAHNLEYLRSYGFKTFSPWIDETYDTIEDDIERMRVIGEEIARLSRLSTTELTDMLMEMKEVLDHNFNRFFSYDFVADVWGELETNFASACDEFVIRNS